MKSLRTNQAVCLAVLLLTFVLLAPGCGMVKGLLADDPGTGSDAGSRPATADASRPVSSAEGSNAVAPASDGVLHRDIVILIDRSPRNWWRTESNKRIREAIVGGCGPGDRVSIVYMRPSFVPEECVRLTACFPPDSTEYYRKPASMDQFDQFTADLNNTWAQVQSLSDQVGQFLDKPVTQEEEHYASVDFADAFRYAAEQLAASDYQEKYLFIFGPLPDGPSALNKASARKPADDESEGGTGASAPSQAVPVALKGVSVKALYCPRPPGFDWDGSVKSWRTYLVEQCGASNFAMLDRPQSRTLGAADLMAPSRVPTKIQSPF